MKREEVAENRKWKVEHIFSSVKEWHLFYAQAEKKIDFARFEGKLGDAATLKECYEAVYAVLSDLERLAIYAFMRHDEDTRNDEFNALSIKSDALEIKFASSIAFMTPELTALPESTLKSFIADPALKDYDYELKTLLKSKAHVLSKETEGVLSLGGQVFGGFRDIFGMIDNADMPFPTIIVDGKKTVLSHGTYGVLMRSPDRAVRKKAFKAYYKAYRSLLNVITATYVGNVNKDVFITRARKYESCLARALDGEDVSPEVYGNLLSSVNEALPLMHRFVRLKKRALKLKKMHMYDMYVPTVENAEIEKDYEEAFAIVKEGLKPLGEEYAALLQTAHDDGWIDVEETEGKRSGAYSTGVYSIPHPYVLLNYQKTTSDVFTIAHELGHAMHTYFSNKNQPHSKADYRIFVAEVASTVNEVLLLKYLIRNTEDVKLKKYLYSYYADMIKGTLFRQTQFAEFEYEAHSAAERGEPLTKEYLSGIYLDLNKKYYGKSIISDEEIAFEWARIPHFYNAFYVYKYATGIIAAISIAERIYSLGADAVKDYFRFLSSGGSDSPVELLKLAGVDLTKKEPYKLAMKSFKEALDGFESIV
ncbi:MAG: oligoendopeptidase F [Clostridia bacterium]|nr:oligoendopeptidase F [Clostridia bacterium]